MSKKRKNRDKEKRQSYAQKAAASMAEAENAENVTKDSGNTEESTDQAQETKAQTAADDRTQEEKKQTADSRGQESKTEAGAQEKTADRDEREGRPKETPEELDRLSGTALENRIFQAIDLGEVDVFQRCYPRHEPDKYWDSKIDIVVNETRGSYEKLPTGIRVYLLPIHIGYLCQSPNPELEELEDTLHREMKKTIPDKERTIFLEETLRRMVALDDRYLRDKLKCIVLLYDSLDSLDDNRYIEKWQDRICDDICDHLRGNQKLLSNAVRYAGLDDYPQMLATELKIAAGHEDAEEEDTQDVSSSKKWILTAVIGVLVVVLAICYVVVMHGRGGDAAGSGSARQGTGPSVEATTAAPGSSQSAVQGTADTAQTADTADTAQTAGETQTANAAQTASSQSTAGEADTSNTAGTADTSSTETTQQETQADMSDVPAEGETMTITQTYTVYSEMTEDDSKQEGQVINGYAVIVDKAYDTGWIQITYYTGSPLTEHTGYIKYK